MYMVFCALLYSKNSASSFIYKHIKEQKREKEGGGGGILGINIFYTFKPLQKNVSLNLIISHTSV